MKKMSKNVKKMFKSLLGLLLVATTTVQAQDPHISQFYAAPTHLNPAMTGLFNGNYRATSLYRSQWGEVLQGEQVGSFRTIWAGADIRIPTGQGYIKNNAISVSLNAMNDKAGDAQFGTTQMGLGLSYMQALDQRARQFIVVGLQGNFYQQSFDASALRLGHQWSGLVYDANIPITGDQLFLNFNESQTYFDASAGALWFMKGRDDRTNGYVGFALHHVNQPTIDISPVGNSDVAKLPSKYVVHAGTRFPVGRQFDLMPKALAMSQGTSKEIMLGSDVRYNFDRYDLNSNSFRFGAMYRLVDGVQSESLVLLTGIDYNGLNFNIAYDVNLSGFSPATATRGAYELSVIYTGQFNQRQSTRLACPTF